MFHDKTFQIAVIVSLFIHGAVFLHYKGADIFNKKNLNQKIEKKEVQYIKELLENKSDLRKENEPFFKIPEKITLNKSSLPNFIDKEKINLSKNKDLSGRFDLARPVFEKPEVIAVKKKIVLSASGPEKIDSPSYATHSQVVREKIRRALYQNYNSMETGEVYLSFVLNKDGRLKDVHFLEEKSSKSEYLREIALRSVRYASPFPPFPKELDYDQLSFTVIISFEID